ncbi:MAG: hypothetical protein WBZ19_04080, partial [Chthoniobacterales bacterium]
PLLRSTGFEDNLSDKARALYCRPLKSASQARHAPQAGRGRSRKDDDEDENEAPDAAALPLTSHLSPITILPPLPGRFLPAQNISHFKSFFLYEHNI